eukprot:2668476-Rhodomonas_salina.1
MEEEEGIAPASGQSAVLRLPLKDCAAQRPLIHAQVQQQDVLFALRPENGACVRKLNSSFVWKDCV